jgi:vancomycin permeability regulator SanA
VSGAAFRVCFRSLSALTIAGLAIVAIANWRVLDTFGAPVSSAPETYDAAIVPGCHVDGLRPAPMLAARLEAALDLYRSGRVGRVLVTGNAGAGETAAMRHWLVAHGVPARDILVDGRGLRTLASMKNAAETFGVRRAVICTQKLHMARSLYLAREAGIEATGSQAEVDWSKSLKWQSVEALKRTLAFTEVRFLGKLDRGATLVASN